MTRCSGRTISVICLLLFVSIQCVHASDATQGELIRQINQPDTVTMELVLDWSSIESFYRSRKYLPVWSAGGVLNSHATQLRQTLHVADQEGLEPADYHLKTINQLWVHPCYQDLAILDILLTDALLRYASDVHNGRYIPDKEIQKWYVTSSRVNSITLLNEALTSPDFELYLQQLPPPHLGYQRLRDALQKLQLLAHKQAWPVLPPGPSLQEGIQHPQVVLLRQRLQAEDNRPMIVSDTNNRFDQPLSYAVQRFQVRHGLKMDGVVGPATRAALNVPIEHRIKQIRRNLERWRWLPANLGERYIVVNSAAYNLSVIDNDKIQFTMWVVIGEEHRQTPVVNGTMHTIVINPYWTVPNKLVFEDLIPAQLKNPQYLQRKKIRVISSIARNTDIDPAKVDWTRYTRDDFPYVLRQDPGTENPLGRIKFLFNNPFEVYLHDTPKRYLFNESKRAFSAGCIRVENPVQLASFLLADQPDWEDDRLGAALQSDKTLEIDLRNRIPVYLLYLTAWVGEDETVYFYDDVYDRDKALN